MGKELRPWYVEECCREFGLFVGVGACREGIVLAEMAWEREETATVGVCKAMDGPT